MFKLWAKGVTLEVVTLMFRFRGNNFYSVMLRVLHVSV